ncbi:Hypothetical_protein [Hexamita inflata]|uniref:Hypothetical_protein n=1 Tax=Hexamita inflata TaxID=28002 RepID=A0AA86R2Y5_9EUKA|nr:Hypothetical protein HINF_LOCUS58416 [Hexamita inflata]
MDNQANELFSAMYASKKNQRWCLDIFTEVSQVTDKYARQLQKIVQQSTVPFPQFDDFPHQLVVSFVNQLQISAINLSQSLTKMCADAEITRHQLGVQTRPFLQKYDDSVRQKQKIDSELSTLRKNLQSINQQNTDQSKTDAKTQKLTYQLDKVLLSQNNVIDCQKRILEAVHPLNESRMNLNRDLLEQIELHFSLYILKINDQLKLLSENTNGKTGQIINMDLNKTLEIAMAEKDDPII